MRRSKHIHKACCEAENNDKETQSDDHSHDEHGVRCHAVQQNYIYTQKPNKLTHSNTTIFYQTGPANYFNLVRKLSTKNV